MLRYSLLFLFLFTIQDVFLCYICNGIGGGMAPYRLLPLLQLNLQLYYTNRSTETREVIGTI